MHSNATLAGKRGCNDHCNDQARQCTILLAWQAYSVSGLHQQQRHVLQHLLSIPQQRPPAAGHDIGRRPTLLRRQQHAGHDGAVC